jgi:hypothetical protein
MFFVRQKATPTPTPLVRCPRFAVEIKHIKQQQLQAAAQHHTRVTRLKAWRAWHIKAKQNKTGRAAASRWKRPCMVGLTLRLGATTHVRSC